MIGKGTNTTPNGTYQRPTRTVAAILALLVLVPGAMAAQSGGNPWNPYPLQAPPAAPIHTMPPAVPSYAGDAPAQRPQVAPQQHPQTRERFAPPGLEQALSVSPLLQTTKPRQQPAPTATTGPNTGLILAPPQAQASIRPDRQPIPRKQGPAIRKHTETVPRHRAMAAIRKATTAVAIRPPTVAVAIPAMGQTAPSAPLVFPVEQTDLARSPATQQTEEHQVSIYRLSDFSKSVTILRRAVTGAPCHPVEGRYLGHPALSGHCAHQTRRDRHAADVSLRQPRRPAPAIPRKRRNHGSAGVVGYVHRPAAETGATAGVSPVVFRKSGGF